MRALRGVFVLVLALALSAPVLAADLQAGADAFLRGDYATALIEIRPLAEQGDAQAQAMLGFMYLYGEGVPQNYAEAMKWFRLAAVQGLARAQHWLGRMYEFGEGVPQDYAEAIKWYRLAAEQGYGHALLFLGLRYSAGEGVTQDYVQAHMWVNLAAAHLPRGELCGVAIRARDAMEVLMTPDQLAEAQRLASKWKPK